VCSLASLSSYSGARPEKSTILMVPLEMMLYVPSAVHAASVFRLLTSWMPMVHKDHAMEQVQDKYNKQPKKKYINTI